MLKVLPFRGIRFDPRRVPLGLALCPPYDVIGERAAKRLRACEYNAIHLESPGGGAERYLRAAKTWRRWNQEGALLRDEQPCYYVVEQRFRHGGRSLRRLGLLAVLGLDSAGPSRVRPHEKTLSKPKRDRLRLLAALRINTSPIFGLYSDSSGALRRVLERAARRGPAVRGRALDGVSFRLWKTNGRSAEAIERLFRPKTVLIADGHHRFEVARSYYRSRNRGAGRMLVYLCAEEDPGLLVLPTHRVLVPPKEAWRRIQALCRLAPAASLRQAERLIKKARSPYAFGVVTPEGRCFVAAPKSRGGARSGLVVEWFSRNLLDGVDPHDIRYTHDAPEAARIAKRERGLALIVPSVDVRAIRRAADAIGLLPQKSTYFYPKIATGLAFHSFS